MNQRKRIEVLVISLLMLATVPLCVTLPEPWKLAAMISGIGLAMILVDVVTEQKNP